MAKYRREYIFDDDNQSSFRGIKILLTVLFIILLIGICIYFVNQAQNQKISLNSENISVMALDKEFEGFRILHISDLNGSFLGSSYEKWDRLLTGQKWNAVVCSGDMVGNSGNSEPFLSLIHELLLLNPDAPIFFVAGDKDQNPVSATIKGSPEIMVDWILEAQKAGAIYLDAPVSIDVGKRKVWLSPAYLYDMNIDYSADSLRIQLEKMEEEGVQYEIEGDTNYRTMAYRLDCMERTKAAIELMSTKDLQIAVNHIPLEKNYIRNAITYADTQSTFNFRAVDLVLCGHFCCGQYCLPNENPIYVEDLGFFPGKENVQGMQRINSVNMYISPGLSSSGTGLFSFRLFCKPSVSIIKFTSVIQ